MWEVLGGLVLGWLAREWEVRHLRQLLTASDHDCREATNRLLQAWKDGYTVPDVEGAPIEVEPLPAPLQSLVQEYEDPAAQAKVEAALRRKLNAGRTVDQILMDAEVGQL